MVLLSGWIGNELAQLRIIAPTCTTWEQVAACFPRHSALDCQHTWYSVFGKAIRHRGPWAMDENDRLHFATSLTSDWVAIAYVVATRDCDQCQSRWKYIQNKRAAKVRDERAMKTERPHVALWSTDLATPLHATQDDTSPRSVMEARNWQSSAEVPSPTTSDINLVQAATSIGSMVQPAVQTEAMDTVVARPAAYTQQAQGQEAFAMWFDTAFQPRRCASSAQHSELGQGNSTALCGKVML